MGMAIKSVVGVSMVQAASRGIGLEFVKQLLSLNDEKKGGHVIATCRNPQGATGLVDLKAKFSDRLHILPLDLTDETTIEASAEFVKERYGSLNLLINASGILSVPSIRMHPETTLSKVRKSSLMLAYEVNAVGPILVVKHMWPFLKAGGGGDERDTAVVANLSARVGSIGDNRLGGWHSYRSSKSALNQLTKTISVEFARRKDPIVCLALHPGTVDTDLSRPFQKNVPQGKLFTKEFSVQSLLTIINNAQIQDNGKFFAWDGQEIPW